jgi:type I site-specific restriction endonuclease
LRRINEAKTRKELIDPALESAGWHLRDKSRVGLEIPVNGYDAQPWNGVTDYYPEPIPAAAGLPGAVIGRQAGQG